MGVKVREKVKGSGEYWLFVNHGSKRTSKKVGTRQAAREAARKIEEEITLKRFNMEHPEERKIITFAEVARRWMTEHVELKMKPSSQFYYRGILNRKWLPEYGCFEFAAITRRDIKAVVARWIEVGKDIRSIPNYLRTLRAIFAWAIEEDIVHANPCLSPARIFKVDRYEADFLQPEEVGTYLDAALKWAPRYYTLFRLDIHSGIRPGETIGLKWGDIDWSGKFLHVQRTNWRGHIGTPKSGKSRKVTLSNEMLAVLKEHRRKAAEEALARGYPLPEWVFTNGAGNPMDESKVWKAHSIVLKAAGLRHIPLKNLRTTYGSLMVSAGVPMFHASKLLGHSSVETTERYYTKLAEGAASEAPEVLERYISGKSAPPAHPEATANMLAKMPARGTA